MKFDLDGVIKAISERVVELLVSKIQIEQYDQLMNKSELAKKMKCDKSVVDELYVSKPGFPKIIPKPGAQPRFSNKAVDKWIDENQIYSM